MATPLTVLRRADIVPRFLPKQLDLEPCPQVVIGFEVRTQIGHAWVPLGQLSDDAGTLMAGGKEVPNEVVAQGGGELSFVERLGRLGHRASPALCRR